MNEKVAKKTKALINSVKQDPTYIRYLDLQDQLKEHHEINNLIIEIKNLQKQATKDEHIGICIEETEQLINNKTTKLNNIPLYIEYSNALEQVNDNFNLVNDKINNYIEEQVNF